MIVVQGDQVLRKPKTPNSMHGLNDASIKESQLSIWERQFPEALIAVRTGAESDLLAIDIDPRGTVWYADNASRLNCKRVHHTPRGKHLLYRYPDGVVIGNSAGRITPGVDVRGNGGYVIWWPAHGHETVGDLADIGDAPLWLVDELAKPEAETPATKKGSTVSGGRVVEGSRNDYLSGEAFRFRKQGLDVEQIHAAIAALNAARCTPPLDDAEVRAIADGKKKITAGPEPASGGRAGVVIVAPGRLAEALDETIKLLAPQAEGLGLYANAGRLVTVSYQEREGFHGPDGKPESVSTLELIAKSRAALGVDISRAVEYRAQRTKRGGEKYFVAHDTPDKLVSALFDAPDKWTDFPRIDRIAQTPLIRGNELTVNNGLHGTVYVNAPIIELPSKLNRAEAKKALQFVSGWLSEFPFTGEADRALGIGLLLTAAVRVSIDTAPAIIISKPSFGAGATTIVKLAGVIATGSAPPVLTLEGGEHEFGKMLTAALIQGRSVLALDNAPEGQPVSNTILAQILSEPSIALRILGASSMHECDTGRLITITGVNVTAAADLQRRTLVLNLDPRMECPEQRKFRRPNLIEEATRDRAKLLRALFTISIAYIRSNEDVNITPYAGYEQWSRCVAEPLVWLGLPDVIINSRPKVADDPTLVGLARLMPLWLTAGGERGIGIKAAVDCTKDYDRKMKIGGAVYLALCDVTDAKVFNGHPELNYRAAGKWLSKVAGRVVNGMRFVQDGLDRTGVQRWKVERLQGVGESAS